MTRLELDQYYGPAQAEVLTTLPGLTGLWQVSGRNRLTYAQRRRLDLFLVRHYSWRLCAQILLRTVREVLRPRDAW
jgi:lipopolysaccharide/colanic/teichoic acid biosynthesis glycosyltransferase